jgi:hypothetical protein
MTATTGGDGPVEPGTEPGTEANVEPRADAGPEPSAEPSPEPGGLVVVTRSGGFAGMTLRGQVNLDHLDEADLTTWRAALRDGFAQLSAHEPSPDRFVYRVRNATAGVDVTVGDHELPDDLRSLLDAAIRPPT